MRIIVCGGRDFNNIAFIWSRLDRIHAATPIAELLTGGANFKKEIGVDYQANEWAKTKPNIRRYVSEADWDKYGDAAGPIRNAHMLTWKPDKVIAFEGGRGTANMKRLAREAGVPVEEIE